MSSAGEKEFKVPSPVSEKTIEVLENVDDQESFEFRRFNFLSLEDDDDHDDDCKQERRLGGGLFLWINVKPGVPQVRDGSGKLHLQAAWST